jgi:shikimate kinase
MKTNVAIVGFMGSGKTAAGISLAHHLGYKYISSDAFIEGNYGFNIPYIFEQEGEIRFRELEIQAIKRISREHKAVIDCGGGVVLNTINIQRLKEKAFVVYLYADLPVILRRLCGEPALRPLVKDKNSDEIRAIMKFREPFYLAAADGRINTSKLDIEAVTRRILTMLKKNADFNYEK